MKSFLARVAAEVLSNHKDNLRHVVVVLPTRRACLFFRKHLGEQISNPVWSPEIVAINDFILSVSSVTVPDDIELIAELYNVYRKYFPDESFDSFYPWGKIMLGDFDEIDRWLVNAEHIFSTIAGMREIDEQFGLPPETTERIRQFAEMFFAGEQGKVKKEFSELWNKLYLIYSGFNKSLSERNLAYEGMAYRLAAERITDKEYVKSLAQKHFVFAGFYALSASEEKIIRSLRDKNQAELFWDSDEYYFDNENHEAGHFLRNNSLLDKNKFNWKENNFSDDKNIRIIGVPLQVGQAKAAGVLVKEILQKKSEEENIAVVLPDEKMLIPVLHSLPSVAKELNITMGYPLVQSPLMTLVASVVDMHKHSKKEKSGLLFYHKHVKEILLHPYITSLERNDSEKLLRQIEETEYIYVPSSVLISENAPAYRKIFFTEINSLEKIFATLQGLAEMLLLDSGKSGYFSSLDIECVAVFHSQLNRLAEIINRKMPEIKLNTLWNLIIEIMRPQKIPFSGVPLSGLQLMGFLETRALDFENVILLNVNEGTLPSSSRSNSFVPFVLRKSYGLPTFTEQDAIYSYHFYRLLQRAKNIFLLYDTEVKKLATGEKSRFILQIIHELSNRNNVTEELMTTPVRLKEVQPIVVEKDDAVMKVLEKFFKHEDKANASNSFSASKLLCYINCPLQFYFRYVAGLKETEDMTDEIDEKTFGTLLHESIKSLYGGVKILDEKVILRLKEDVSKTVDGVFASEIPQKAAMLNGKNLLMKRAVEELVYKILAADLEQAPIEIFFLERNIYAPFSLKDNRNVTLYGIMDRADKVNGVVRVIDYKSGRVSGMKYKDVEELFAGPEKKELFQLMFYVLLFNSAEQNAKPAAGIYKMREISEGPRYLNDNPLPVSDDSVAEFRLRLGKLIEEVTDNKIPFSQTNDEERCVYCEFKDICMR
ncbi:MAG: PD-(D/E)XK nuclease family protein [Bacteroidia bacterium]|nr:PD-(D/E)XK nuclease family protein [Bacteroidia bacterium]